MAKLKNRIVKLEKLQPSGLQHLSDEELNARITAMCNKSELQEWVKNNNNDLQLSINKLMTLDH
ncbi:hypothetical protein [Nitrosomonas ureae]|uniref:Uncharacterized protein n=1 Tax=Nitrosomonas ureae TaxID=44577 RepID=A0A1H5RWB6_9PROT|nr:hypothetical protein [Nitrosomonas ureae]SEF42609.1 hypothetical protein SAMN05216334_101277 [Nitrosomonas ureae]